MCTKNKKEMHWVNALLRCQFVSVPKFRLDKRKWELGIRVTENSDHKNFRANNPFFGLNEKIVSDTFIHKCLARLQATCFQATF